MDKKHCLIASQTKELLGLTQDLRKFIPAAGIIGSFLIYHPMNGKDIIKRLRAEGWQLSRIQGGHHILT